MSQLSQTQKSQREESIKDSRSRSGRQVKRGQESAYGSLKRSYEKRRKHRKRGFGRGLGSGWGRSEYVSGNFEGGKLKVTEEEQGETNSSDQYQDKLFKGDLGLGFKFKKEKFFDSEVGEKDRNLDAKQSAFQDLAGVEFAETEFKMFPDFGVFEFHGEAKRTKKTKQAVCALGEGGFSFPRRSRREEYKEGNEGRQGGKDGIEERQNGELVKEQIEDLRVSMGSNHSKERDQNLQKKEGSTERHWGGLFETPENRTRRMIFSSGQAPQLRRILKMAYKNSPSTPKNRNNQSHVNGVLNEFEQENFAAKEDNKKTPSWGAKLTFVMSKYINSEKVKADARYVQLWLDYLNVVKCPDEALVYMHSKGIGKLTPQTYFLWTAYFVWNKQFMLAVEAFALFKSAGSKMVEKSDWKGLGGIRDDQSAREHFHNLYSLGEEELRGLMRMVITRDFYMKPYFLDERDVGPSQSFQKQRRIAKKYGVIAGISQSQMKGIKEKTLKSYLSLVLERVYAFDEIYGRELSHVFSQKGSLRPSLESRNSSDRENSGRNRGAKNTNSNNNKNQNKIQNQGGFEAKDYSNGILESGSFMKRYRESSQSRLASRIIEDMREKSCQIQILKLRRSFATSFSIQQVPPRERSAVNAQMIQISSNEGSLANTPEEIRASRASRVYRAPGRLQARKSYSRIDLKALHQRSASIRLETPSPCHPIRKSRSSHRKIPLPIRRLSDLLNRRKYSNVDYEIYVSPTSHNGDTPLESLALEYEYYRKKYEQFGNAKRGKLSTRRRFWNSKEYRQWGELDLDTQLMTRPYHREIEKLISFFGNRNEAEDVFFVKESNRRRLKIMIEKKIIASNVLGRRSSKDKRSRLKARARRQKQGGVKERARAKGVEDIVEMRLRMREGVGTSSPFKRPANNLIPRALKFKKRNSIQNDSIRPLPRGDLSRS